MSDKSLSSLTVATVLTAASLLYAVVDGSSRQITLATLFANEPVSSLVTLALADDTADFLKVYDTSASAWKKVLGQNLGFTQDGTGAVLRSLQDKLSDTVNAYDFGVTGNGVTDDTTALQNAFNQCGTSGKRLDIGPGVYQISSAINMTAHVVVQGAGWDNTLIRLTSATQDGIVINSENGGSITGLEVRGTSSSSQTAGALVRITGPSGGNQNQIYFLRDLRLLWGFISIDFDAAQVWTIDNCYTLGNPLTGVGIVIDNTEFPGNGELNISNTLIQGGDASTTWGGSGILHRSGVNLKITNSEIFGWVNGYNLTLNDATAMAGTYISNSVFSQVENAITLNKGTGTQYNLISIIGNQIYARNPIATDANTGWLSDVTITSNVIGVGQGQPVSSSTGTAISLAAVDTFTVIGNTIQGGAGNNSIVIGADSSNGYVAGNPIDDGVSAPSNSSTTTVLIHYDQATGVLSHTGATGGYTFDRLLTASVTGNAARFVNASDSASVQVARFEGDRATMADNDEAYISLMLSNDGGTQTEFARLTWIAADVNAATNVDGTLSFGLAVAGSVVSKAILTSTVWAPALNDGLSLGFAGTGWSDLFGASGFVLNLANGDWVATHTSGILTVGTGDLRVTSAGTNAASVVTVGGTQTLINKTLTSAVLTTPQINDTSADHQYVFAVSELAADRTVTLPLLGGDDTFVFANFVQTLANKTLTSAVLTTPEINDTSADHQYVFAVSELAADRTVTLPLLAANDTFVFANFTQTLANKTLTSPTVNTSLLMDSGAFIDFNSNDVRITHSANALSFSGATNYNLDGALNLTNATDFWTGINFIGTNASANAGPFFNIFRDSASPAANDQIGAIVFDGRDSGGTSTRYAQIGAQIIDHTDGSEDGRLNIQTISAGTAATHLALERTATATHTALLIWDTDNATLERVSVGAADSGGAGFKVLRIPN